MALDTEFDRIPPHRETECDDDQAEDETTESASAASSANRSGQEEDYYVLLNVDRRATVDQINAAYRRLSRLYHPDKHASDAAARRHAELLFTRLKRAHEVLRDTHLRAVYDQLGAAAVRTLSQQQLATASQSPDQLLRQYERLARRAAFDRLRQRTNPRGTCTLYINATDLLTPYQPYLYTPDAGADGRQQQVAEEVEDEEELELTLPHMEVAGMTFTQSVEAPLDTRHVVSLSGHLATRNGTGSGQLACSVRRTVSAGCWLELEAGVGSGLMLATRAYRTVGRWAHVTGGAYMFLLREGLAQAGLSAALGCRLGDNTLGQLTWRAGVPSSVHVQLVRDTAVCRLRTACQLGVPTSFISADLHLKQLHLPQQRLQAASSQPFSCRASAKLATGGLSVELSLEQRLPRALDDAGGEGGGAVPAVGPASSISAALLASVLDGVAVRLRLTRAGQQYQLHVQLAEQLVPAALVYGALAPTVAGWLLRVLVLQPYAERQRRLATDRSSDEARQQRAERRREARATVALMTETVARVRHWERQRDGLLLQAAWYGPRLERAGAGDGQWRPPADGAAVLDVTVPLQCLVHESTLSLAAGSKSCLPGFCDPLPSDHRSDAEHDQDDQLWLLVFYTCGGHSCRALCRDHEPLTLPHASHRLRS